MNLSPVAAAWHERALELATWAMARFANRFDAWGKYHPAGGQMTVYGELTIGDFILHYRTFDRSTVIGLHTASADNRSLGGALDIDYHGEGSNPADVNLAAAIHWHDQLVKRGFRPLLTESNGKGGYHLRVLLTEAIDASRVFHLLRWLTADHAQLGLGSPPEQFPKQPDVRRCEKGLGNWLRLPGRHHTRDFWSRVWDGSRWLEGHEAINFMLSLAGDPPQFLVPPPPRQRQPEAEPRSMTFQVQPSGGGLQQNIGKYMAKLPNLGEGQGRDNVAFNFACFLVRDLALDDQIALLWLERWDSGNRPPKGRERLVEIIKSAHTYGQRPVGCGRDREQADSGSRVTVHSTGRPGHYVLRSRLEVK